MDNVNNLNGVPNFGHGEPIAETIEAVEPVLAESIERQEEVDGDKPKGGRPKSK